MNIPSHYPVLADSAILQDLYARDFHNDPLLEYVCQRWELLVEGNIDLELELSQERSARDNMALERDALLEKLEELGRVLVS